MRVRSYSRMRRKVRDHLLDERGQTLCKVTIVVQNENSHGVP
jgi:hypothetical protein